MEAQKAALSPLRPTPEGAADRSKARWLMGSCLLRPVWRGRMSIFSAVEQALAEVETAWNAVDAAVMSGRFAAPDEAAIMSLTILKSVCPPERMPNYPLLWISPEMVDLLSTAAKTLEPYRFRARALPWQSAFCVLGKPAQVDDVPIEAFVWSDLAGDPPPSGQQATSSHVLAALERNMYTRKGLFPVLFSTLSEGRPICGGEFCDGSLDHDWDLFERLVCSLWLLVQQRVAVQRVAPVSRAERRRWGRDHDTPIPEVVLVELRRPASTTHEDTAGVHVDWSHRWIVDGHWRNQYHPSTGEHVPTWIAPHIKGPDDKPLVVKRKVNAWVR